jgi:hypothetical protein
MNRATRQADLFAAQPDLFDGAPPRTIAPAPEMIRARLDSMLAAVRQARRMPWNAQRARTNEAVFNQMANWLPEADRDALRAEFTCELRRLRAVG